MSGSLALAFRALALALGYLKRCLAYYWIGRLSEPAVCLTPKNDTKDSKNISRGHGHLARMVTRNIEETMTSHECVELVDNPVLPGT